MGIHGGGGEIDTTKRTGGKPKVSKVPSGRTCVMGTTRNCLESAGFTTTEIEAKSAGASFPEDDLKTTRPRIVSPVVNGSDTASRFSVPTAIRFSDQKVVGEPTASRVTPRILGAEMEGSVRT